MSPSAAVGPALWLDNIRDISVVARAPLPVTAVCYDSRSVVPGALFVAVPGFDVDGHDFLRQAMERGAAALLVQADRREAWASIAEEGGVLVVSVPDARAALAQAAAGFYGRPAERLGVVGVTGTDGKTTTVHRIADLLDWLGRPTGYLSSVSFKSGEQIDPNDSHMTTLEAPEVQRRLAEMVARGRDWAVIEASSHGLALHRVDECAFDVAVFTTLSRDHLDFHGTMEEYREAKGRLFSMLDETLEKERVKKAAVLNADDEASEYFRTLTKAPVVTYGIEKDADVTAQEIRDDADGLHFELRHGKRRVGVSTRLIGRYNVYNCLAAAAVGVSQGYNLDALADGLRRFEGIPARMERLDEGQAFAVILDIASTPVAMRRVLEALRPRTSGRLIAVFGAAGERDPARRDGMGRVAGELADFSVLTNEDPRREDPDAIIEAIASGLREADRQEGRDFERMPDRREAIRRAFERAQPGDTVLLAGKGTEPSIVMADGPIPWDERAVARELLRKLVGGK